MCSHVQYELQNSLLFIYTSKYIIVLWKVRLIYSFLFIRCSYRGKYHEKYWCRVYCGVTCLVASAPLLDQIACTYYLTKHSAICGCIFLVCVDRVKFPPLWVVFWLWDDCGDQTRCYLEFMHFLAGICGFTDIYFMSRYSWCCWAILNGTPFIVLFCNEWFSHWS